MKVIPLLLVSGAVIMNNSTKHHLFTLIVPLCAHMVMLSNMCVRILLQYYKIIGCLHFEQFHCYSRYIFEVLGPLLTSSHRIPYKTANFCWDGRSVSVYTRIPMFVCFAGRLVNTPRDD